MSSGPSWRSKERGVVVGARTRIQSHAFVCELVTIGEDTFISHGVCFVNDVFRRGGPANRDASQWESTRVGSNVSIGSGATILPVGDLRWHRDRSRCRRHPQH